MRLSPIELRQQLLRDLQGVMRGCFRSFGPVFWRSCLVLARLIEDRKRNLVDQGGDAELALEGVQGKHCYITLSDGRHAFCRQGATTYECEHECMPSAYTK